MLSGSRRKFLADAAAAAVAMAAGGQSLGIPDPDLEFLRSQLPGADLDRNTFDGLEGMVVALGHAERSTTRPLDLLPAVRGVMQTLSSALRDTTSGTPTHRRLLSLAGETCAYKGWAHWDSGNMEAAERSFRSGLECAAEAGDKALGAYLLGCISVWPMRIEKPERRLSILDSNFRGITVADATPQVAGWLAALRAGAHAKLGNETHFERNREVVEVSLLDVGERPAHRPRVDFFNTSYWKEELAAYLLELGRQDDALPPLWASRQSRYALEAASVVGEALPKANGRVAMWLHLDGAAAYNELLEPELAIAHATTALEMASAGKIQPIIDSLHLLAQRMRKTMPTIELREFEERLHIA